MRVQTIVNGVVEFDKTYPDAVTPPGPVDPPVEPPKPPVSGEPSPSPIKTYPGPDLFTAADKRIKTGDLHKGQSVKAGFTAPAGNKKMHETGISGQNLKLYINGVEHMAPYVPQAGHYLMEVVCVGDMANGSVDNWFHNMG